MFGRATYPTAAFSLIITTWWSILWSYPEFELQTRKSHSHEDLNRQLGAELATL